MRLPRVDKALEDCERHLSTTSSFGTEIEILLTSSLLVLICAEFEQKLEAIIQEKCSSIADASLRELVLSCISIVFRSIQSSEMAGLLNRFGGNYKATFREKADANPRAETFYNNIVTNRHGVAHSSGSNVTFLEVKRFYEEGHIVLDYFQDALL